MSDCPYCSRVEELIYKLELKNEEIKHYKAQQDERRIGFINITFEQYNALIKQVEESVQKVYALTEGFIEAQKTYREALQKCDPFTLFNQCAFCVHTKEQGHNINCEYVQLTKEKT